MEPNEKIVLISVWDQETNEIIEMEIEQAALDAMDAAQREIEEHRLAARKREQEELRYVRDDE